MSQTQSSRPSDNRNRPRTLAEWTTSGIAIAILAGIAGLIAYSWLAGEDQPPVLTVSQNSATRQAKGSFYVPFSIRNTGSKTAESVQVTAELRINGQVQATGEQQIEFLSAGETEEGAFVFNRDPSQSELTLRVASYKLP